ncbi:uncharacterized protein J8A68_004253 [[Candida] subhashii]|uniref:Uncharacterized protein n=1 Tax=[Candida] subhashii TaxID=561895 RepID=A0A8J5QKR2_9ASCO|nr:uncharacterized protein J8A68_004253 [[Candida] subhashii]KAG7662243.1 hypothetical protein J8A68_004253 [[Candida] subhashii]
MSNYESLNEYISREYTDDENDLESTHSYYSSSASVSSSSEYSLTAQEQWDESMKQIQALVEGLVKLFGEDLPIGGGLRYELFRSFAYDEGINEINII